MVVAISVVKPARTRAAAALVAILAAGAVHGEIQEKEKKQKRKKKKKPMGRRFSLPLFASEAAKAKASDHGDLETTKPTSQEGSRSE